MLFDRWFRRGASAPAICVNEPEPAPVRSAVNNSPLDQTMVLRRGDLEALRARIAKEVSASAMPVVDTRVAELEAVVASQVVQLEAFRATRSAQTSERAPVATVAKPAKVKAVAKKLAAPKPTKLAALAFWRMHGQAVDAIRAVYGDNWRTAAPFGETELVELASGYRRAKTERGTILRWSKDQRIPSARYWPGQAFPDGVTTNPDYARADPLRIAYERRRTDVAWLIRERHAHKAGSRERLRIDGQARERLEELRAMPKPAPATKRDAAWHKRHGYAWSGKEWIAEILLRSQRDHQEFILAEREAKRLQALERACLTYGPQPLCADVDLAEAAD
jgi:hypothetical protein